MGSASSVIRLLVAAASFAGVAQSAVAQPSNDNCTNAQLLVCNASVTFSNAAATDPPSDPLFSCQYVGPAHGYGSLWFRFVAADSSAMLTTCASPQVADTLLAVYDVGNPANPCTTLSEIACNDDAGCGSAGTRSRLCATDLVPGRTYYVQVAGFAPTDRGLITLALSCPCPGNDTCQGALPVACNSATSFSNAEASESLSDPQFVCSGLAGSGTVWFRFTAAAASALVSVCDDTQVRDTLLALYAVANPQDPCHSLIQIACNDDGCGIGEPLHSHFCVSGLTVGATYYIEAAGFNPADRGAMTLAVTCPCAPACVTCPPGSSNEGEPLCANGYVDTYDGGCASTPPVFLPIACGQVFCGTSGTFTTNSLAFRDTDWYEFTLDSEQPITVRVTAEFPIHLIIVDPNPDCLRRAVRAIATAPACQEAVLTTCLSAGTHWLFVAPGIFDNVPCGRTYAGRMVCGCACRGDMNGDGGADASDIQSFVNCFINPPPVGCCACADLNESGVLDEDDVYQFAKRLSGGALCP